MENEFLLFFLKILVQDSSDVLICVQQKVVKNYFGSQNLNSSIKIYIFKINNFP